MPQHRHPELDGYDLQPLYTFELHTQGQKLRQRLLWGLTGLVTGVVLTVAATVVPPFWTEWSGWQQAEPAIEEDPFQQGLEQGMMAAELTQTAEFQEEWGDVAVRWQQAIAHMQAVPPEHPDYATARAKVAEYTRNLQYARSNLQSRTPQQPANQSYWTIGSDLDLVIGIQGMPSRIIRYENSCKEIMYYDDSVVELRNGYVSEYSDLDGIFKVLAQGPTALSIHGRPDAWTLGSTKTEVVRVQGTPTRSIQYQSNVTLYYGNSSISLEEGQVVGYSDYDDNLNVVTQPRPLGESTSPPQFWTLGASRTEVLQAQNQTPTAINRRDRSCEEVFYFEDSSVVFRQGIVAEYKNTSQNLRIP